MAGSSSAYTRRDFLKTSGSGLTLALMFGAGGLTTKAIADPAILSEAAVGAWVRIRPDGTVLIFNPAAEMGQGSMTALPVIIAEEMDADWSKVEIEHSPIEPEIYGRSWRPGGPGNMMTVGSQAVRGYFTKLRRAGAQIRKFLLQAAAEQLGVPISELTTRPGVVVHAASGRTISYGEIAATAEPPAELPEITDDELKSPASFQIIGHSVPRHDVPAKTDGTAVFAMDVHVPDMVVAMVVRSPVHNGEVASYNAAEIEQLPGIIQTVPLGYGVGIVGNGFHEVRQARSVLKVEWIEGPAKGLDSEAKLASYADVADGGRAPARSVVDQGDVAAGLQASVKQYEADFYSDHVYHAQMEPLCAVVSVSPNADTAEVWVGTQNTAGARQEVARALGIGRDAVTLHPCYLGGGFGRRSTSDYVLEAVHLSKAVKRPVKLIWTREDDLQYGMYRPMNLQRLTAGVDGEGNITAWTHCVIGDGGGLLTSGIRNEFYDMPNQLIELCSVPTGVRLKHWRAVGHGFNKFAIEAFIDEVAADQGVDPYRYRRRMMHNEPRARAVIDAVAEMSNWDASPQDGRAKGMAFGERSGALAAGVAEVSVDDNGKIHVHKFWCATDAGIIIQPGNAAAQIEGGIAYGLSSTLLERITLKDGHVQQSNFHDYQLLRMADMPDVEVKFIDSYEKPEGLGEASTPLVAAAVANAFAALTGKRLYHMPFTPERVKAVLG